MQRLLTVCAALGVFAQVCAQTPGPRVIIADHGEHTGIAGPGAPKHIIGLPRLSHTIAMNTGIRTYGLQYTVAHDPKRPGVAIPGEGYIGMSLPANCNWYAGGFFDLIINGKSIGSTPVHSFIGRKVGNRGVVDFVFDTPLSLVRIRFVTFAGDDALYCQALLEPKTEIKGLQVRLSCYPSAFVSNAERHVLTPTRDLAQDERADLDLTKEWWLLYYDRIFDAGHAGTSRTGVGPCSVLWLGKQTRKVGFSVGRYGTRTIMDFNPGQRDLRLIFFDYKGIKNKVVISDLRKRAPELRRKLAALRFVDDSVVNWPLVRKQQEVTRILATMPGATKAAEQYRTWAAELAKQIKLVKAGGAGAIRAESAAVSIIQQWEKSIPDLKLKALLKGI